MKKAYLEVMNAICDVVEANKQELIQKIIEEKLAMFDNNTHGWAPLKPQTIARKKREKTLFRAPESINIRKGDLFKGFINEENYQTTKSPGQIEFAIDVSGVPFGEYKVETVAKYGRDVVELSQEDLDKLADSINTIICKALTKYE